MSFNTWLHNQIEQLLSSGQNPARCVGSLVRAGQAYDAVVTTFLGERSDSGTTMERLTIRESFRNQIIKGPRGTWGLLSRERGDGSKIFRVLISAGNGSMGISDDLEHFVVRPSWQIAYQAMVTTECLDLIETICLQRQIEANLKAIRDHHLEKGSKFRSVRIGGSSFSSLVISKVSEAGYQAGFVHATVVRTGSRRANNILIEAEHLVHALNVPRQEANLAM